MIQNLIVQAEVNGMKIKKIVLFLVILILSLIACIFILLNFGEEKHTSKDATNTDISVFINNLPSIDSTNRNKFKIFYFKSYWIINGKIYKVNNKTSFSPNDSRVFWKIDLSCLSNCGYYDGWDFFSNSGGSSDDLMIAVKDNTLIILESNEILSPYKYSILDFSIVSQSDKSTDINLELLWENHLSKEYNICSVACEDEPEYVLLKLKEHPELQYQISFVSCLGDFYSRLPYEN